MDVGGMEENQEEEEAPTSDPENDDDGAESEPLERLLRNLKQMQNEALSTERFADASDLQTPIMAVLEATSSGAGLSIMEVVTAARNPMQRLYRTSRNRGEAWRADVYKAYADNFQLLLQ